MLLAGNFAFFQNGWKKRCVNVLIKRNDHDFLLVEQTMLNDLHDWCFVILSYLFEMGGKLFENVHVFLALLLFRELISKFVLSIEICWHRWVFRWCLQCKYLHDTQILLTMLDILASCFLGLSICYAVFSWCLWQVTDPKLLSMYATWLVTKMS